jgi:hypothetical protein
MKNACDRRIVFYLNQPENVSVVADVCTRKHANCFIWSTKNLTVVQLGGHSLHAPSDITHAERKPSAN